MSSQLSKIPKIVVPGCDFILTQLILTSSTNLLTGDVSKLWSRSIIHKRFETVTLRCPTFNRLSQSARQAFRWYKLKLTGPINESHLLALVNTTGRGANYRSQQEVLADRVQIHARDGTLVISPPLQVSDEAWYICECDGHLLGKIHLSLPGML